MPAIADSDSGTITVEVIVGEIIELTVDEPTLSASVNSTRPTDLATDLTDAGRAEFTVAANVPYTLTATVPETFTAGGPARRARQVRFVDETTGHFIGGSLFIERNIEDAAREGPREPAIEAWDGDAGRIAFTMPAGSSVFGLGGVFDATLAGDSGGYREDLIAPPGRYSTVVTLTATAQ